MHQPDIVVDTVKLQNVTSYIYIFQSGQFVLELVDHYGGTFLVLFCALSEIIGVFYIYGNSYLNLDCITENYFMWRSEADFVPIQSATIPYN